MLICRSARWLTQNTDHGIVPPNAVNDRRALFARSACSCTTCALSVLATVVRPPRAFFRLAHQLEAGVGDQQGVLGQLVEKTPEQEPLGGPGQTEPERPREHRARVHQQQAADLRRALVASCKAQHGVGGGARRVEHAPVDADGDQPARRPRLARRPPGHLAQTRGQRVDRRSAATHHGLDEALVRGADAAPPGQAGPQHTERRSEPLGERRRGVPAHEDAAQGDGQRAPAGRAARRERGEERGQEFDEDAPVIVRARGVSAADQCLHCGLRWSDGLLQHNNHRPGGRARLRFL